MPTTWNTRTPPETSWGERLRPITFETPLQDAYTEVADEDNEVIYILADTGHPVPSTFWTERDPI